MNFIDGEVLLIDKPYEWTSFNIVHKMRAIICGKLKIKKLKVGHAGTLDPLATGLLLICTGKMTKQIDTLQAQKKQYTATLKLGATTPSFDCETNENLTYPFEHITPELFAEAIQQFIGEVEQVPPIFSAKKVDGKRAYEAARKGEEFELKPNKIVIYSIELLEFRLPNVQIKIDCSKGTYIRALARDIGAALNSGAYLTQLRRTKIGDYCVENAIEISEFKKIVDNLQPI